MIPGLQVSKPDDTTLVLTRWFKAPRHVLWEALTRPDKMRRWMLPPPSFTLDICEVEPRVGGKLHLTWNSADATPAMMLDGEWTELHPHTRMVHTETMKLGTGEVVFSLVEAHELTDEDGGTRLVITQTYESKDARDGSGMDEGMETCYRALDAVVGA